MRKAFLIFISMSLVCACSGPIGPIAGGKLEGIPAPWAADWSYTDQVQNMLLQTNPEDPYSVTVWLVTQNNQLYVASSSLDNQWTQNMVKEPFVVLSIEGRLFDAAAYLVEDQGEADPVIEAYLTKYEIESRDDFVQEGGVLFRLQPR